ncbi:type II toxin-antitoxin system TacA family antitoxin [Asanoa siamensis]|uniref:DUF1778 domain-containing protein n=1 Tax=Asanoa siamensis TaxID=926357 RepID=A0ABQ4CY15_9ACTN|nr:DUF1778 domain-containing protein [Asanoa siamensis]GIF76182.1 hypothetical protein Asi02nite_57000 [Asanoa siamensis]
MSERLHLRVEPGQKALLEAASEATGTSLETFVVSAATEAAATMLADPRLFLLDEAGWRVFDDALARPAVAVWGPPELLDPDRR